MRHLIMLGGSKVRNESYSLTLLVALSACIGSLAAQAGAQTFVPVKQNRGVHAYSAAYGNGTVIDQDHQTSKDFGEFAAAVDSIAFLTSSVNASGSASQVSSLTSNAINFSASNEGSAEACCGCNTQADSDHYSLWELTFDLLVPSCITFEVDYSKTGTGWALARVLLFEGETEIVSKLYTSSTINEFEVSVPPGQYWLSLIAGVFLEADGCCGDEFSASNNFNIQVSFGSGCFEAIDPNYPNTPLIVDGQISTDFESLASEGLERDGLVADGVTPLVLRWEVPGPGTVEYRISDENHANIGVGQLRSIGGSEQDQTEVTVDVQPLADGRFMAFAVLIAPGDFVRAGNASDELAAVRLINIEAEYFPEGGGPNALLVNETQLYRPPVVLLHGLEDKAESWNWDLENDGRFVVYAHDYHETHSEFFNTNRTVVKAAVEGAIAKLRLLLGSIAATQADIIGHSMGGSLARLYALDVFEEEGHIWTTQFIRSNNYLQGDIHKLITLNTPHFGSPLSAISVTLENVLTVYGQAFLWLTDGILDRCTVCGAARDLRPDSVILSTINQTPMAVPIPVHAIYGTGGTASPISPLYNFRMQLIAITCYNDLSSLSQQVSKLFGDGEEHDAVLRATSQRGGLSPSFVTEIDDGWAEGLHFPVINEHPSGQANARVIELLNARLDEGLFRLDGFPLGAPEPVLPEPCIKPTLEELEMTFPPAAGRVEWEAGESIEVLVTPVGKQIPDVVAITSSWGEIQDLSEAPFLFTLTVPLSALGPESLFAIGYAADATVWTSDEFTALVVTSATLTGLQTNQDTIFLFSYASEASAHIFGLYDDGVERNVTAPELGTTYVSQDQLIAEVDEQGRITGRHVGSTIVVASNRGFEVEIDVMVLSALGDGDGDGAVDETDAQQFMACFTGPFEDPGFEFPSAACVDKFDFDFDGDIDCDDWDGFKDAWTAWPKNPPPFAECGECLADLDGNGSVGVKDLLFLLGAWGPCPKKGACLADFDTSGDVGVKDLLFLLGAWGPCP